MLNPFAKGKGHSVKENFCPSQQLFPRKFENCFCKCAHHREV